MFRVCRHLGIPNPSLYRLGDNRSIWLQQNGGVLAPPIEIRLFNDASIPTMICVQLLLPFNLLDNYSKEDENKLPRTQARTCMHRTGNLMYKFVTLNSGR